MKNSHQVAPLRLYVFDDHADEALAPGWRQLVDIKVGSFQSP